MWLVIFPEGTRYNVDIPEQKKRSQEFAESRGRCMVECKKDNATLYKVLDSAN